MPRSPAPPATAPWSIADMERETGLGKDTLRVWERRYGFPTPTRDALGERRYDDAQFQRLRVIKRLLDNGHRPRQVVALPPRQLQALIAQVDAAPAVRARQALPAPLDADLDAAQAKPDVGDSAAGAPPRPAGPTDVRWMQWLQDNQIDTLRQAIRQHLLRHGLAATIESLIAPLGVQVGEAWLAGRLSVYQEHLYTEAVQSLLREAMATLDTLRTDSPRSPRVVLATLPKEKHGLGLLMAESFLALEGCECRALGPGTPLTELVQAALQLQADVVALSFSAHAAPQEVVHSLRQLRDQLPASIAIWVGGAAPVLYARRRPAGVVALRRAQDLVQQVAQWRQAHPPPAAPVAPSHAA